MSRPFMESSQLRTRDLCYLSIGVGWQAGMTVPGFCPQCPRAGVTVSQGHLLTGAQLPFKGHELWQNSLSCFSDWDDCQLGTAL